MCHMSPYVIKYVHEIYVKNISNEKCENEEMFYLKLFFEKGILVQ